MIPTEDAEGEGLWLYAPTRNMNYIQYRTTFTWEFPRCSENSCFYYCYWLLMN